MKTQAIAVTAAGLLTFAGCTAAQRPPDATAVERPAPAPAAAPAAAPPAVEEFSYCGITGPGIAEDTSISRFTATDRSEYCRGFVYGYDYADPGTPLCEEFWATPDTAILDLLMSPDGGSNNRDAAIGMIDALWAVC